MMGRQDARQVIELLKNSEAANLGRYDSGQVEFTLRRTVVTEGNAAGESHEVIEGRVRWRGNQVRTDLLRQGPAPSARDLKRYEALGESSIVDDSRFIHLANNGTVVIDSIANKTLSSEHAMAPVDYWYALPLFEGMAASDLLERMLDNPNLKGVQVSVTPESEEAVRVVCADSEGMGRVEITLLYSHDANLSSFSYQNFQSGFALRIKNEWDRDERGAVFLKKSDRATTHKVDGGTTTTSEQYETRGFPSFAAIGPEVFTMESLPIKAGAVVRDLVRGRTHRLGDQPTSQVADSLPGLIQKMRNRGFASVERRD